MTDDKQDKQFSYAVGGVLQYSLLADSAERMATQCMAMAVEYDKAATAYAALEKVAANEILLRLFRESKQSESVLSKLERRKAWILSRRVDTLRRYAASLNPHIDREDMDVIDTIPQIEPLAVGEIAPTPAPAPPPTPPATAADPTQGFIVVVEIEKPEKAADTEAKAEDKTE